MILKQLVLSAAFSVLATQSDARLLGALRADDSAALLRFIEEDESIAGDESLLRLAASASSNKCLAVLLEVRHAGPVEDANGETAAHYAALGRNCDGLVLLCEKWPDILGRSNRMGWLPVHFAAASGASECIAPLFASTVSHATALKQTPLHLAALRPNPDAFDVLLSSRADAFALDVFGFSAKQYRLPKLVAAAPGALASGAPARLLAYAERTRSSPFDYPQGLVFGLWSDGFAFYVDSAEGVGRNKVGIVRGDPAMVVQWLAECVDGGIDVRGDHGAGDAVCVSPSVGVWRCRMVGVTTQALQEDAFFSAAAYRSIFFAEVASLRLRWLGDSLAEEVSAEELRQRLKERELGPSGGLRLPPQDR